MILEQIEKDYLTALKNKETEKVAVLRLLKSALANARISAGKELDQSQELAVLNKEVKSREDSIIQYKAGNRPELAEQEQKEIDIIKTYMPEQLSEKELESVINQVIEQTGADSMADMGKVMGQVTSKVQGKADNSKIAEIVKNKLSN